MIPTMTDDATYARYVANIIATWHDANSDQLARGRAWYRTANQLATLMAEGNTRAGAGLFAVMSPQKAWAHSAGAASEAGENSAPHGHAEDVSRAAERIMLGEDPLQVLPTDPKTWNLFRCLTEPDDLEAVVIDRHAHEIAVGDVSADADAPDLGSKKLYALFALAYRQAAWKLDETPSVVQAVTWLVHVERAR
jgi:hypothetical protein